MPLAQVHRLYPANHKTVFVLDHTPYFGISCENPIEFEFMKNRTSSFIPLAPISKSLWTCSVESAIEYCRVVWDLFPSGKMIRFVASDVVAHILNTWAPVQQNLNHIMNAMSLIGVPPAPPPLRAANTIDYTVLHGLRAAIETLCECTDLQYKVICKRNEAAGSSAHGSTSARKLINRCRVICITSARDNDSMTRLQDIFLSVLQQQNRIVIDPATQRNNVIPIDHCHLVILNTYPIDLADPQVSNQRLRQLSPLLTTEVHSLKASLLAAKLAALVLDHYDLASTTVTGIPMKEEQNASSSANYDVEIYHSRDAHVALWQMIPHIASSLIADPSIGSVIKPVIASGHEYNTVTLKWCTPRGCTTNELHNCISMNRITPVDVNSRPSLCLINFLLNGRAVMLEMAVPHSIASQRLKGGNILTSTAGGSLAPSGSRSLMSSGRITSHMLAARGGEIFIHTLSTARSVLEDPPSVGEGCGGRVTDYRITDFGMLIKQNCLLPIREDAVMADEGASTSSSAASTSSAVLATSTKDADVPSQKTHSSLMGSVKLLPIQRMRNRLRRLTKYWPITISSTIIFNLKSYIDPMPAILFKEHITDQELLQCKHIIFNLISLESKHDTNLLAALAGSGYQKPSKGQKREDQFKAMWNELEVLVRSNLHSIVHRTIYAALLECRTMMASISSGSAAGDSQAAGGSSKNSPTHQQTTILEAIAVLLGIADAQTTATTSTVIRATTDSPMSPPSAHTPPSSAPMEVVAEKVVKRPSLYDIVKTEHDRKVALRARPDFYGHIHKLKLYRNLKLPDEETPARTQTEQ